MSNLSNCVSSVDLLRTLAEIGNAYRGPNANCVATLKRGFVTITDGDLMQTFNYHREYGDLSAFGIKYEDYGLICDILWQR
jgi:hypothetical protein